MRELIDGNLRDYPDPEGAAVRIIIFFCHATRFQEYNLKRGNGRGVSVIADHVSFCCNVCCLLFSIFSFFLRFTMSPFKIYFRQPGLNDYKRKCGKYYRLMFIYKDVFFF